MPRYASIIQIPNLPVAITLNGSEQVEVVQAGTSCRTTTGAIANAATIVKAPNYSTAQKNALTASAGWLVFDTDLSKLCVYNGSTWETITSV
jgi:hypothetical protein